MNYYVKDKKISEVVTCPEYIKYIYKMLENVYEEDTCLLVLNKQDDICSLKQLSEVLGISYRNATVFVNKMIELGVIEMVYEQRGRLTRCVSLKISEYPQKKTKPKHFDRRPHTKVI
jgi:DNA-binding MarR family transcriptional regulator